METYFVFAVVVLAIVTLAIAKVILGKDSK